MSSHRSSFRRRLAASAAAVCLATTVFFASAPISSAQSVDSLERDVSGASDFRIKVSAALTLGKLKQRSSLPVLVKALGDTQPSVRAAAAAALASFGDLSAVAPLESARDRETTPSVKAQMESSVAKLRSSATIPTKFLITVGRLENKSGVSSSNVSSAFKSAVRSKISALPGVELLGESTDATVESKRRKLPTVTLDGNLLKLQKSAAGTDVGFAAKVEFVIRKVPEHSLKGSVSGDARALANAGSVRGDKEMNQLQVDAVTAAVESALKGAPIALEAAAK